MRAVQTEVVPRHQIRVQVSDGLGEARGVALVDTEDDGLGHPIRRRQVGGQPTSGLPRTLWQDKQALDELGP